MKIKSLILGAALAIASVAPAFSQAYHSDSLLFTNTWLNTFPTNFVPANYFFVSDPNNPAAGSGLFEIKPQASALNAPLTTQEGVTYQLTYAQTAYSNIIASPFLGTNGTITAIFQPLLDDTTIKELGTLAQVTNNQMYTIPFTLSVLATNPGSYYIATATGFSTNTVNCKWVKLVGFTASANFTNGLQIRSLRVGYPGPVAAPQSQ